MRPLPDVLRDVALTDRPGRWDVSLDGGTFGSVSKHEAGRPARPDERTLDAGGRLLAPGLVDAHVHLDKALQLTSLDLDSGGTSLDDAMSATAALRERLTDRDVERAADRLLRTLHAHGTVALRAHVEVGAGTGALVELHRRLAAAHPEVRMQLCAFPQNGTNGDDGEALLVDALDAGAQVVGGCPYADADPARHLEFVASLAHDRGLPLDLHLDFSDSPDDSLLGPALDVVERHGLGGWTTFGHVTTLTAMEPGRALDHVRRIADLGVTVVALPATDLFLSGLDQDRAPTRGLTRVRALWEHGVGVALGSNNHENAFTPVSGGGLLRTAWLAAVAGQFASPDEHARLFDAVTAVPAGVAGTSLPAVAAGSAVRHVLLDATDAGDAVRKAPEPSAVLTAAGMYLPPAVEVSGAQS